MVTMVRLTNILRLYPIASRGLCLVESVVGAFQRLLYFVPGLVLRQTDRHRDPEVGVGIAEAELLGLASQSVGYDPGSLHVGIRENQQEFFPAVASEIVRRSHALHDAAGKAAQHVIARLMAECVVYLLEEIYIHEGDAERRSGPGAAALFVPEHFHEMAAVVYTGKLITRGQFLDSVERLLQVGFAQRQ